MHQSAGGDTQTQSVASFSLTQIIAYPTPTLTQGPGHNKTYKRLEPGRHVFRVKARDRAGNLDTTPAVKRFRIKKR